MWHGSTLGSEGLDPDPYPSTTRPPYPRVSGGKGHKRRVKGTPDTHGLEGNRGLCPTFSLFYCLNIPQELRSLIAPQ